MLIKSFIQRRKYHVVEAQTILGLLLPKTVNDFFPVDHDDVPSLSIGCIIASSTIF